MVATRTSRKSKQPAAKTESPPSAAPPPRARSESPAAPPPKAPNGGSSPVIPAAAAALLVALLAAGGGGRAPAGGGGEGELLGELIATVSDARWAQGTPLGKKLQHCLSRPPRGSSATGARSIVVGGDAGTSAARAEFVRLLAPWAEARGGCPEGGEGWRVDVDGASLDAAGGERLLEQLASSGCAATLVVVTNAHLVDGDVMQLFEPLLSGEGPQLRTDALVVLELETDQPLVPKGFEGRCAEASGAKRYGCAEKGLQEWVRENAWKRRGLLGRIGLFVPLE